MNVATSTRAFFAGIGTTIVILAASFGGGLMMAKSALKEPSDYHTRATREAISPARVILPASAEPAQPPQLPQQHQQQASSPLDMTQPPIQPAKQVDIGKRKAEERKRRYAERQARRQAQKQRQPPQREGAPIMAFSGESTPRFGGGFGN